LNNGQVSAFLYYRLFFCENANSVPQNEAI
jgi:hypothetical protein